MIPKIEKYIQAHPACASFFGDRVQPFGYAFKGTDAPYATWQTVGGEPYNNLSCAPDSDFISLQFDVFDKTIKELDASAKVLMSALERHGYVTNFNLCIRDTSTGLYRCSFDFDLILERS